MGNCTSTDAADVAEPTEFNNGSEKKGLSKRSSMSKTMSKSFRDIFVGDDAEAPIGIDVVVYEPLNVIVSKALAKKSPPFAVDSIYAVGTSADNKGKAKKSIYYFIRVKVKNDNGKIRKFTIYRRYSQFEQLNKDLNAGKKYPAIPKFPKKQLFTTTNANIDSINLRKTELNKWLGLVASRVTDIMKDEVFQKFITEGAVEIDYSDQISDLNQILCVFLPEDGNTNANIDPQREGGAGEDGDGMTNDSDSEGSNDLEAFIDVDFAMELIPQPGEDALEMLEEFGRQPMGGGGVSDSSHASNGDPSSEAHTNLSFDYDGIVSFGKHPDPKGKPGAVVITYMIQVTYTDELTGRKFKLITFKRYSEFTTLRDLLVKSFSAFKVPLLPKKTFFGTHTNDDVDKMVERRSKLNDWLRDITDQLPNIKSDPSYYVFMTGEPNNIPDDYSVHMSLLANSRASFC